MPVKSMYVVVCLAALLAPFAVFAADNIRVSVRTDRDDALYSVNEPITFHIGVEQGEGTVDTGSIAYSLTLDGWKELAKGTLTLGTKPPLVTETLDTPGFLRCTVTYVDPDGKKHTGVAAGGVDPLRIEPSLPVPEDFDDYWSEQRAALAEVPMNPRLEPVAVDTPGVACFDVQLDCLGGAPVSGYYCRPENAAPKSLPAILWVHGAGVRSSIKRPDVAAEGFIVLDINAHGIPNGKPKEFYTDLAKGELADYRHRGRESRETCYFRGMYLRLMRAMEFLTAQPEWDGEILFARGSSQGGGQALVAAGLEPRVTALIANVPAMCDHTGMINGWPRLVPRDSSGNPDPKIQEVARYFDAMNFATRTKADALVSVGFIDNTCRPTTVYAAYNNLQGTKRMRNYPLMTHAVPKGWYEETMEFMKAHAASRD